MSAPPVNRAPRFPLRVSAELEVGDDLLTGVTRNLSEGGVGIVVTRSIAPGTILSVTLFAVEDGVEAEGAEGLSIDAEVRWVKEEVGGYAIGLQFRDMPEQKRRALGMALRRLGAA